MPRAVVGERKCNAMSPLLFLMSVTAPTNEIQEAEEVAQLVEAVQQHNEAPTTKIVVVESAKSVADCHVHGHHGACECSWSERVKHFDWLHILVEINVHILLHAVLVIMARKLKHQYKKRRHHKGHKSSTSSTSS